MSKFEFEDADDFWRTFNEKASAAQVELCELSLNDLPTLKQKLIGLQAFATEATRVLPPYDIKRTQEILNELSKATHVKEEELKPKKKFSFKSRNKSAAPAVAKAAAIGEEKKVVVDDAKSKEDDESTCFNVQGKENEEITLTKEDIGYSDNGVIRSLLIKGCKNTTIYARCVLGSVRLEECSNCHFFLGPVQTSIYLEENSSCVMFLACHQLRIHRSIDCTLYVKVNSHPIIEDCKGLVFAPYAVQYQAYSAHLEDASLTEAKCWDNVVDFRWHRSTQSPNWSLLAEDQRVLRKVVRERGSTVMEGAVTIWGFGGTEKESIGEGETIFSNVEEIACVNKGDENDDDEM